MKTIKKNKKNGFTLIEMLVAITLFSFVVTSALGALYMVLKANEKTKVLKLVVNNLNIALEEMSREIRTGYEYDCAGGNECTTFHFKTRDQCEGYFKFDSSEKVILRKIKKKKPSDAYGTCSGGDQEEVEITSSDVDIEDLKFRTTGIGGGDDIQPRVLITLKGVVHRGILENPETFFIQSTISQRELEP